MTDKVALPPHGVLEEFFGGFETLIKQITDALLKHADGDDETAVIKEGAAPIPAQISEMKTYVLTRAATATNSELAEVNQALRMSNAKGLFKSGKGLLGNIGSLLGKLGIQRIVQEIKKIVRLIFKTFGWAMPAWLDLILLIINQLLNLIFGTKSPKHAAVLSDAEVNYLREVEAAVDVMNAEARGRESEESESWD